MGVPICAEHAAARTAAYSAQSAGRAAVTLTMNGIGQNVALEVGLSFWPLVPRLAPVLVLARIAALLQPALRSGIGRGASRAVPAVLALILVSGGVAMFYPHGEITGVAEAPVATQANAGASNWQYYGRTPKGTRFAHDAQINRENVNDLQVAWTFRTGDPEKYVVISAGGARQSPDRGDYVVAYALPAKTAPVKSASR